METTGRPNLSLIGIDEVEVGVCEDTIENRAILRTHDYSWRLEYDEDGKVTGNIEALSAEMKVDGVLQTLDTKARLLTDPRDKNSDYRSGLDLLLDDSALLGCPTWVVVETRRWVEIERRREAEPDKKISETVKGPPGRCRQIKSDGVRCMMFHSGRHDDPYCRAHSTTRMRRHDVAAMVIRARERVMEASIAATDTLESMLRAESEQVRLKAATEILDRAGVRGGVEIDTNVLVEVRPAGEILAERLSRLALGAKNAEALMNPPAEDIEEAEVVEDE